MKTITIITYSAVAFSCSAALRLRRNAQAGGLSASRLRRRSLRYLVHRWDLVR